MCKDPLVPLYCSSLTSIAQAHYKLYCIFTYQVTIWSMHKAAQYSYKCVVNDVTKNLFVNSSNTHLKQHMLHSLSLQSDW